MTLELSAITQSVYTGNSTENDMHALPATLICALVCCCSLSSGIPTPQDEGQTAGAATAPTSQVHEQHETVSNSHMVSAADGYLVQVSESQVNTKCVSYLKISGNGINKTAEYACGKAPIDIIIQNKSLLVGDEWFSDQPKVLIHLSGNQCHKEVFTEQDGKISSTSETLGDDDCEKVRTKISEVKERQRKWKEWLIQQQIAAQQQFQQLQQNLMSLQNQLFGTWFGGK